MFHQTIIQGNLGTAVELKTLSSGSDVANFRVAVNEKWKSDGEKQEHTEWYNVKIFGKQAEIADKYLNKGDLVMLVGRLRTRSYDKDGDTRYVTELIVDKLVLQDNRGRESGGKDRDEKPSRREEPRRESRERPNDQNKGQERSRSATRTEGRDVDRERSRRGAERDPGSDDEFDDDAEIPF